MTTEPVTLSLDDDLQDAVKLVIEEKMGGYPWSMTWRDWWES